MPGTDLHVVVVYDVSLLHVLHWLSEQTFIPIDVLDDELHWYEK
jgi:hypothetical protein